jgi:hypothetical protein
MIPQHVVVTVARFHIEIYGNVVRVTRTWVIESGRFRAEIEECPCGLRGVVGRRTIGKRTNCLCNNETCHNNPERKGVCHGWHGPRLAAMVAQIERPKPWKTARVGVPKVAPRDMAGLNGYRWADIYG